MDMRELGGGLFVAGQIAPADIAALNARGVRAIICNRPDGEAADQPTFATIAAAAAVAGMEARHIPVKPGAMGDADIAAFAAALAELPKPILAFCRTGARSTALHDRAQAIASGAAV